MKLLDYERVYDFGYEYYLDILKTKKFTVLSIIYLQELDQCPPCMCLTFGLGQLASLLFGFHVFTFKIVLFKQTWPILKYSVSSQDLFR